MCLNYFSSRPHTYCFFLFLNCNLSVYIGLDVIESTTNINSVNVGNITIRFNYEFKMSMNCFTPTVALLDVLGENILNHYKQHEVTQISKMLFKVL